MTGKRKPLKFVGAKLSEPKARLTNRRFMEARRVEVRGTKAERGYDEEWRKASKDYLEARPFCEYCALEKRRTSAVLVDHLYPHGLRRGRRSYAQVSLFWFRAFWVSCCMKCHNGMKRQVERAGIEALDELADRLGRTVLAAQKYRAIVSDVCKGRGG
jgi:5-methylcytosine-specific restriction protein A